MHRVNTIFIPYVVGYHSVEDTVLRRSFRLRCREVSYVDIDVSEGSIMDALINAVCSPEVLVSTYQSTGSCKIG